MKIRKKLCKNCLFSDNRLVSEDAAQRIIDETLEKDSFFICHESSIESGQVCCKGFFDNHKNDSLQTRLALMLNIFEFVETDCKISFKPFKDRK